MYKEIVKECDYDQIVRNTFEDDYELFEFYHFITGDKDKALNDTIEKSPSLYKIDIQIK